MVKKLALAALALLLLGPFLLLVDVGLLANPAASAACTTPGGLNVGPVPDSLTVRAKDGSTFTLNKRQLTHAATIISAGSKIEGVTRDGVQIALMAALTESTLRMLSNTGTYPDSAGYPNDGDGGDHDSLGLFQMRPQSGWGSVKDLMDSAYQVRAFFGGPTGPNYPSPRGLLDIPGWQSMDKGQAAQAVEVSANPDRYQNYEPAAKTILDTLTTPATSSDDKPNASIPETSRVVFPLPEGTWVLTSPFGYRTHPVTGERSLHEGTDYAAPDGTPIYAAADGIVAVAEYTDAWGGHIVIDHTIDGRPVSTGYIHMWKTGIHVSVGQQVTAGQHIGDVGSSGRSTGPHLHFEVRPAGRDPSTPTSGSKPTAPPARPAETLRARAAADAPPALPAAPRPRSAGTAGRWWRTPPRRGGSPRAWPRPWPRPRRRSQRRRGRAGRRAPDKSPSTPWAGRAT